MKKTAILLIILFFATTVVAKKNYLILNNGKSKKLLFQKTDQKAIIDKQTRKMKFIKRSNFSQKSTIPTYNKDELPVFTNRAGTKIIPTGNIIIKLKKSIDYEKWTKKNNLKIIKIVSYENNIILIKSPAGIKAIEISNKLANQKEILYISPNMWTETNMR